MPAVEGSHLEETLRRLEALLQRWPHAAAVIGGVAIVARVRPRHTDDVDVVVVVPSGAGQQFLELAHELGWTDEPAETKLLLEGGLLHLSPSPGGAAVDFIFVDSTFLQEVVDRSSRLDLGVATLPVVSLEDLLLLKLEAHRPEDIDDILAIKDVGGLDLDRLRRDAERLGLRDRLELYLGP